MFFWVGTLLDGYKAIDNGGRYLNVINLDWIYNIHSNLAPSGSAKTASGLFISKVPPTKATVVKVSQDIVDSPVKPGDTIAYIDRCKWIAGECLLNVEMVLAIL